MNPVARTPAGLSPVFCTSAPLVIFVLSPSVSQSLIRVSMLSTQCICSQKNRVEVLSFTLLTAVSAIPSLSDR